MVVSPCWIFVGGLDDGVVSVCNSSPNVGWHISGVELVKNRSQNMSLWNAWSVQKFLHQLEIWIFVLLDMSLVGKIFSSMILNLDPTFQTLSKAWPTSKDTEYSFVCCDPMVLAKTKFMLFCQSLSILSSIVLSSSLIRSTKYLLVAVGSFLGFRIKIISAIFNCFGHTFKLKMAFYTRLPPKYPR